MAKKESRFCPATEKESPVRDFFGEMPLGFLLHEFKGPLAIIESGLAPLLDQQAKFGELTRPQERALKRALRSTFKLKGMVSSLIETGRSETGLGLKAAFDPVEALYSELVEAVEAGSGEPLGETDPDPLDRAGLDTELERLGVAVRFDPELAETRVTQDERHFRTAAANLMRNGFKFKRDKLEVRLGSANGRLCLEVEDDGPGIREEDKEIIFTAYAQSDQPAKSQGRGHGLGLAIARHLARSMGGEVELSSEPGRGTVMSLSIPLGGEPAGSDRGDTE